MSRPAAIAVILMGITAPALAQPLQAQNGIAGPPSSDRSAGSPDARLAQAYPAAAYPPAAERAPAGGGTPLRPLPAPDVPESASAETFLRAALTAVAQNRGGMARESLEMAQTRLLDRSVALGQTRNPSDDPAVRQISTAMQSLSAGDRAGATKQIEDVLAIIGRPAR